MVLWIGIAAVLLLFVVPLAIRAIPFVGNAVSIAIALGAGAAVLLGAWLIFDFGAETGQYVFFGTTLFVYVAFWVERFDDSELQMYIACEQRRKATERPEDGP